MEINNITQEIIDKTNLLTSTVGDLGSIFDKLKSQMTPEQKQEVESFEKEFASKKNEIDNFVNQFLKNGN